MKLFIEELEARRTPIVAAGPGDVVGLLITPGNVVEAHGNAANAAGHSPAVKFQPYYFVTTMAVGEEDGGGFGVPF